VSKVFKSRNDISPAAEDASELAPFENGFTARAAVATVFCALVMMPMTIYLRLAGGTGLGQAGMWVTMLLLVEVARRSFVKLKQQEIVILMSLLGFVAITGGPFEALIWNRFFTQSAQAANAGITEHVPRWVSPSPDSEAMATRSFFQWEWAGPIALAVGALLLGHILSLSLGFVLFRVTNDLERLPFPLAPVTAGGAIALADSSADRDTWRWRAFLFGIFIGVAWTFATGLFPYLTGRFLKASMNIFTFLEFDYSVRLHWFLPAAIFGISLNLGGLLLGMVLPFPIVVGMTAASLVAHVGVNPLLVATGVAKDWQLGMSVGATTQTLQKNFWLSASMGIGFGVAAISLLTMVKRLTQRVDRAEQEDVDRLRRQRGDFPLWLCGVIAACALLGQVVLCRYLIPNFRFWILVTLGLIYAPMMSYVTARLVGMMGGGQWAQIPHMKEGVLLLSRYQGVDVWFAPLPMNDVGGAVQTFKQLELTRTRFSSLLYATAFGLPLVVIGSFFFWSVFWRLAPIPSGAYDVAQKNWPAEAYHRSIWMSLTLPGTAGREALATAVHPQFMVGAGVLVLAVFGLFSYLSWPLALFYGAIGGYAQAPAAMIGHLLGALIGRYAIAPRLGPDNWQRYAPVLLAGFGCGVGLLHGIGLTIHILDKAVKYTVY